MYHRIRLLILLIFFSITSSYDILDPDTRPLLSFLVGTTAPSECIYKCTEPLKQPLIDFVNEEITMESKDEICSAYEKTTNCIQNNTECTYHDRQILEKLMYGFRWACGGQGYDPFEHINPCIVTLGKEVRRKQNCTTQCHATLKQNLTTESSFPNLIGRFEHTCEPLACFLNCTAHQMNSYCPTGGTRLIVSPTSLHLRILVCQNVVVSAIDELVSEYRKASPVEKMYIKKLIPEQCELFFSEKEMMRLRFDEKFVKDVFYMITSRKQRSIYIARSEAERIIKQMMQKWEEEMEEPEPLSWDLKAVSICAAIIAIMVLNVTGLVFTIWWCVTSKEENGELCATSSADINQFIEPNIRMKLKLPKLRSAAIHDSKQDVFELRVPRNGNQFHLNDEQTIVVPRYKRRRTYSVPLEPRPRTQSTGSDQLPQIVIVRNHEH